MFGIGSTELLVILVVALIVLGPKSLASVSRSLGKLMGEFRRVSTDFQRTLNAEAAEADVRDAEARRRRDADTAAARTPATADAHHTVTPAQPEMDANATDGEKAPLADAGAAPLTPPEPPEDSPLAAALARAREQANAAAASAGRPGAEDAVTATPASTAQEQEPAAARTTPGAVRPDPMTSGEAGAGPRA